MNYKGNELDMIESCYQYGNQPIVYCHMHLQQRIHIVKLHQAVQKCAEVLPELYCHFDLSHNGWIPIPGCSSKNIIFEFEDTCGYPLFHVLRDPQIKIHILHKDTYDIIYFALCHIVCDGSGFKQLIQLLCDFYNDKITSNIHNVHLLTNLKIRKNSQDGKSSRIPTEDMDLPYKQTGSELHSLYLTIEEAMFKRIYTYAKINGVTINDMLLYAYAKVLQSIKQVNRIFIPCPVDLRAFLDTVPAYSIGNFTGSYSCTLDMKEKKPQEILQDIHTQMQQERAHNRDLKLIALLHGVHKILPHAILRMFIHFFYRVPHVSFTNVGIFDDQRITFNDCPIDHLYISTTFREFPRFQLTISTYKNCCTLSCNLMGGEENCEQAKHLLDMIKEELCCLCGSSENLPNAG